MKKYGKAIEQPQGLLPLHHHSEQMDGPTEPKMSHQDPCTGRFCTTFPGAGCLASTQSLSFQQNPSSPTPSRECGCWKGKATLESDGNRRGSDRLEALSSGTVSSLRSADWPQGWKVWLPTKMLKSHSHLLHETSALRLTTFVPLLVSRVGQDREAEATVCITQKGLRTMGFQKQI